MVCFGSGCPILGTGSGAGALYRSRSRYCFPSGLLPGFDAEQCKDCHDIGGVIRTTCCCVVFKESVFKTMSRGGRCPNPSCPTQDPDLSNLKLTPGWKYFEELRSRRWWTRRSEIRYRSNPDAFDPDYSPPARKRKPADGWHYSDRKWFWRRQKNSPAPDLATMESDFQRIYARWRKDPTEVSRRLYSEHNDDDVKKLEGWLRFDVIELLRLSNFRSSTNVCCSSLLESNVEFVTEYLCGKPLSLLLTEGDEQQDQNQKGSEEKERVLSSAFGTASQSPDPVPESFGRQSRERDSVTPLDEDIPAHHSVAERSNDVVKTEATDLRDRSVVATSAPSAAPPLANSLGPHTPGDEMGFSVGDAKNVALGVPCNVKSPGECALDGNNDGSPSASSLPSAIGRGRVPLQRQVVSLSGFDIDALLEISRFQVATSSDAHDFVLRLSGSRNRGKRECSPSRSRGRGSCSGSDWVAPGNGAEFEPFPCVECGGMSHTEADSCRRHVVCNPNSKRKGHDCVVPLSMLTCPLCRHPYTEFGRKAMRQTECCKQAYCGECLDKVNKVGWGCYTPGCSNKPSGLPVRTATVSSSADSPTTILRRLPSRAEVRPFLRQVREEFHPPEHTVAGQDPNVERGNGELYRPISPTLGFAENDEAAFDEQDSPAVTAGGSSNASSSSSANPRVKSHPHPGIPILRALKEQRLRQGEDESAQRRCHHYCQCSNAGLAENVVVLNPGIENDRDVEWALQFEVASVARWDPLAFRLAFFSNPDEITMQIAHHIGLRIPDGTDVEQGHEVSSPMGEFPKYDEQELDFPDVRFSKLKLEVEDFRSSNFMREERKFLAKWNEFLELFKSEKRAEDYGVNVRSVRIAG